MEWLKNFTLPQSTEHIELIGYMLVIVMMLFIVFSSIILWGTLISIYLKRKASKDLDVKYELLSKDIMDTVLFNKMTGIMFCILPGITVILILAQLFQSQNNPNLNFLIYSLVLLVIGLLFIYSYKNSFYMFKQVDINSGLAGSILLFFSLWLFSAAMTSSIYTESSLAADESINLFSGVVLFRFLLLILISLAVTGAILLFRKYNIKKSNADTNEDYSSSAVQLYLKITFAAIVSIPLLIFINMILLPKTSLSGAFFFYLILSVVFLFIAYHLLYQLYKNANKTFAAYLLVLLVLFVLINALSDQMLIAGSNKVQYTMLAAKYDDYLAELKGSDKVVTINGEELYSVRCASCHTFDKKLVGPPHDEVIPKYFGKENQLIAFIRNPVKVNPDYPPMPNPGLKPDEAKAVADYLLSKVKSDLGK